MILTKELVSNSLKTSFSEPS